MGRFRGYLLFALVVSSICFFIIPSLWCIPLLYFLPPLLIALYTTSHFTAAMLALVLGALLDLFSSAPFGLTAISYTLVVYVLYPLHRYLLIESLSTLPCLAFLGSLVHGIVVFALNFFFDIEQAYTPLRFLLLDILLMPLYDVAYTFCFFSLPAFLFWRYHRHPKENYDEDS